MPEPRKGEKHDDYIARCIPVVMKDGTAKDDKQAYAVCESMWNRRGKKRHAADGTDLTNYRSMGVTVTPAATRRATFQGVDYLVAPVVCLVGDVVVRPLGSDGPEYVPASELATAAAAWNGRPILPDHPVGSANSPAVLERQCFGYVFNARYEDGRLKADAYLDPLRAAIVGADATEIIRRCESGEVIEVSVGAWITPILAPGTCKGVAYDIVWSDIKPDHLAVGLAGSPGACSVDMGCGLGRAAASAVAAMLKEDRNVQKLNPLQRMLVAMGWRRAEDYGVSDMELTSAIESKLRSIEPAFGYVSDLFSETRTVIYCCSPEYEYTWFRRTYSIPEGGSAQNVELNDDKVQVERKTSWEPVTVAAAAAAAVDAASTATLVAACSGDKGSCNCGCASHEASNQGEGYAAPANIEGDDMADKKALVDRLLAAKRAPFESSDRAMLEGWPEKKLESLVALAEGGAPAPDTTTVLPTPPVKPEAPAQPVQQPAPQQPQQPAAPAKSEAEIEQEAIAALPAALRGMVHHYQAVERQERTELTTRIVTAADGAYTAEKLAAKSTDDLRDLAKALKVPVAPIDFGGRGIPVAARSEAAVAALTPPSPYAAGLKVLRDQQGA